MYGCFATNQRNFFEINPIYPDLKQDYSNLYEQREKTPYNDHIKKVNNIFESNLQNIT
jgi:hypothetical protein